MYDERCPQQWCAVLNRCGSKEAGVRCTQNPAAASNEPIPSATPPVNFRDLRNAPWRIWEIHPGGEYEKCTLVENMRNTPKQSRSLRQSPVTSQYLRLHPVSVSAAAVGLGKISTSPPPPSYTERTSSVKHVMDTLKRENIKRCSLYKLPMNP